MISSNESDSIPATKEPKTTEAPAKAPTNGFPRHDKNDRGGHDNKSHQSRSHSNRESHSSEFRSNDRPAYDRPKAGAMEVTVEHNIEKAMRILKRKLIKEGLFKELKSRRYYEKPSERKKRKSKESVKKIRKEEARSKKHMTLFA